MPKTKNAGLALFIVIIAVAGMAFAAWYVPKQKGDDATAKKEWKKITNGQLVFEFPDDLVEVNPKADTGSALDYFFKDAGSATEAEEADPFENVDTRVFKYGGNNRMVMQHIINYKKRDEMPEPADALENAVVASLAVSRATDYEWVEPQFDKNTIRTKVQYYYNNELRIGYAIIFFIENHYEIVMMLPFSTNYSEAFKQKFINSFEVL
ncbi:MAG: hypothetical protein KBT02_13285 [Treponema sp.]|nr:hypothetical protein [Candidatus Treponema caballi]